MANEPLDLAALVARLRSAGLKTDIRQYLAAHELLLALAGQGHNLSDDSEALASHLGPIFCGSPEEQQLFRQEFMAWRGEPPAAAAPSEAPIKKKDRRGAWVLAVCAAIAFAGTVGILLVPTPAPPVVSPPPPPDPDPIPETPQPSAIKSAFVVSAPTRVSAGDVPVESKREAAVPWLAIVAGGLGAALLTLLLLWLRQKRRRDHCLSRMAPDPNTRRIELNPPPPTVTNIRTIPLRRISAGLRRTRANEVFDLSVTATVNATANAGGFVVPVFAPRVAIPEYVVLIDRRSESDHSAQLVYGWVTQLSNQGVAADCYEFDSDPRVCRDFGTQRSHRLPALLARHHRATVWLFAESDVCIDPITNRPQEWLRWFNNLPNRVCLTMAPPYRWAANEQRLVEAGFVVVPASPAGMQIAAAMDRNSLEAIGAGAKYAREFPRLIAQDYLRWLDRTPPPDATATRLLRTLHEFLGPDGFSWLCACAIYPQISWPITLTLLDTLLPSGSEIQARKAIDEQLPSIARLPWFRYGYMPDWLRKLLISQLEPEKEALIRSTLEKLVCGLLGSQGASDSAERDADASKLGIRIRPKALDVARAAPANSPLQDEVFLDFLAGAAPDPLSLRLSSVPHIGTSRSRSLATRILERWRAWGVRRPLLLRCLISLLVALPVGLALWAILGRALKPAPVAVPDSDITYFLTSSDLSSSETTVAVAPNGQFMLLASPQAGAFVDIWDLVRNEVRNRVPTRGRPVSLAVSPDSKRIAILDSNAELYLATSDDPAGSLKSLYEMSYVVPQEPALRLRFSSDSSLLIIYGRAGMTLVDFASTTPIGGTRSSVSAVAIDPQNPNRIIASVGDSIHSFEARPLLRDLGPQDAPPLRLLDFSIDGKRMVSSVDQPGSNSFNIVFRDTYSSEPRAEIDYMATKPPSGWVWSGDGNLVAYEEVRGRTAIYDLSSGQLVTTGESRIPATNRLYTIRFVRSDQRAPNNTYYELSERSIDLAPAEIPEEPPKQDDPRQETLPPSPSAQDNAQTEKLKKEVLGSLEPDVRALAQRLVSLAARQGIIVRLTDGRAKDVLHGALRPDSLALHEAGRAFDFAVWSDNGRFVSNDMSRMSRVGKIGKGIGLTWGGDVNASGYMHFELPAKESNATPQPTAEVDKENAGVLSTLDRETSTRARQLLDMARKENMTLSLRSVRQPSRVALRHRSDISAKLDIEGRAFNVAVLMPDGTWSTTDFSMLTQVSKIANGLGFDWSGDWGYGQYFHFELPHAAAKNNDAATPQTNQAPVPESTLRLAQSEFEYPPKGEIELRTVYSGIVYDADGRSIGRFELRNDLVEQKDPRLVARVVVGLYAGRNANAAISAGESAAAQGSLSISAQDFAKDGISSKTASVGVLQFSLRLEGANIPGFAKQPGFDREYLRVRIDVRPVAEAAQQARPPARAD